MKAHIGANAELGLIDAVFGTAANVSDVTGCGLTATPGKHAWRYAGYSDANKRQEMKEGKTKLHVVMCQGKRRALDPERELHQLLDKAERLKVSVRAKVEHPFRVIKQRFGYTKVRYREVERKRARLMMLFAPGNP